MIISTRFVPALFDAITIWPFILIRPECRGDQALIEHEMIHYREQAWVTPIWLLRYKFSRRFRMAAEVRAYKRQIELGGITRERAASLLLEYGLGITCSQALESLK